MLGNGNFAHSDTPEERRLSDTIAADDAITPAICECESVRDAPELERNQCTDQITVKRGMQNTDRAERDVDGGEMNVLAFVF